MEIYSPRHQQENQTGEQGLQLPSGFIGWQKLFPSPGQFKARSPSGSQLWKLELTSICGEVTWFRGNCSRFFRRGRLRNCIHRRGTSIGWLGSKGKPVSFGSVQVIKHTVHPLAYTYFILPFHKVVVTKQFVSVQFISCCSCWKHEFKTRIVHVNLSFLLRKYLAFKE